MFVKDNLFMFVKENLFMFVKDNLFMFIIKMYNNKQLAPEFIIAIKIN